MLTPVAKCAVQRTTQTIVAGSKMYRENKDNNVVTFAIAMVLFNCWPNLAYAYVDPGSVSMVVSGIISGFVACSLFLKKYWYKLKYHFRNKKNKN